MTLLTPWGLLALLAIPAILALHFFRQQKQSRRIGGLHLWDFARIATPAGRRFERLHSSLPLLFQLLAALLLALLLAGFDIPTKSSARHYSIILDDSVSMQARVDGSTSARRAIDAISGWARTVDKFTLVAASGRPSVLAGPAASKQELLTALTAWTPASPVANLDEALNIATKFGSEDSRILLLTDYPDQAKNLEKSATVWGVGRKASNTAIIFADRFKSEANSEKIVATVQSFGSRATQGTLTAYHNDQPVGTQPVDFTTTAPVMVEMQLPVTPDPIRLTLTPEDALQPDDSAILIPAPARVVRVYIPEDLPERAAFVKAALSIRDCLLAPSAAEADLIFTRDSTASPLPSARRVYVFPAEGTSESVRMAPGRDLVSLPESPLARNLALAGVIWPYRTDAPADPRLALRADLSYTSTPLLYQDRATSSGVRYRINLDFASTNVFRHTAWPVLMLNMVEECRSALPGLTRTNLRAGEDLRINLELNPAQPAIVTLWKDGAPAPTQQWETEPPAILTDLLPGSYTLRQGSEKDSPSLGAFRVNLFSQGESDLSPLSEHEPDMKALTSGQLEQTERNMLLFYGLLLALAICIFLGWIYQDAGH